MTTLKEHIAEELKNPEFAALWEESEAEYQMQKAIIAARGEAGMTQEELAKAAGMKREAISRLEAGNANPTIKTIYRIARATGKRVELRFV